MSSPALVLSCDSLVFSDLSRLSGGLVDDRYNPKASCLTSGLTRLLEDLLMDPGRDWAPTLSEIEYHSVPAALYEADASIRHDLDGLQRFVGYSKGFEFGDQVRLGPVETEVFSDDGVMTLDGEAAWRPAGTQATRMVGGHRLTFVVSPVDLVGQVREDPRLDAVAVSREGSQLRLTDETAGSCPVCSACAVCVVCGEVNADAAVAGATGVFSLAGSASYMRNAEKEELQALLDDAVRYQRAGASLQPRIAVN